LQTITLTRSITSSLLLGKAEAYVSLVALLPSPAACRQAMLLAVARRRASVSIVASSPAYDQ
jgi:hypothetical protein